ncbi:hypothetical protein LTR66_014616 [Elasticomyces elasticus]|nr:hypothetical protein LTR66_014616 [Elasticomyces elasticus]
MGGFMQPQGHVQVLLNMLVFNLTPQAALDAPRVCIGAGMPDQGDVFDRTVYLEDGIKKEVAEELKRMGHHVQSLGGMARGLFGRGQVIRWHVDPVEGKGVWSAGSDPRGDGAAIPCMDLQVTFDFEHCYDHVEIPCGQKLAPAIAMTTMKSAKTFRDVAAH